MEVNQNTILNLRELDSLAVKVAGTVQIRFGVSVEIWFEEGHSFEKRSAAVNVYQDYYGIFDQFVTHYLEPNGNRLKKINDNKFPEVFSETIKENNEDIPFDATLCSIDGKDEPTLYSIGGLCFDRLSSKTKHSIINADFPASWVSENSDKFVEMILRWCNVLKPVHGSAGLAPIFDTGGFPKNAYREAFAFVKRFPGLDFINSPYFSLNVRADLKKGNDGRGIRGCNWLTILDDSYLNEVGGVEQLESILKSPDIALHEYDGGLVIQAGALPSLGDINRNLDTPLYRTVNKVLKPIRFENYSKQYLFVPKPLDSVEETLKWVRRFD